MYGNKDRCERRASAECLLPPYAVVGLNLKFKEEPTGQLLIMMPMLADSAGPC